ncbi:MAG: nitroreductase family protein [Eubacterium sp.]|nr:nitroreductase family protein [Eubacterium sp.]
MNYRIDEDKCIGCADCARSCLVGVPVIKEGKALFDPKAVCYCIECGHCISICQQGAISVTGRTEDREVSTKEALSGLASFLRSRRSVRHFHPESLSSDMIEEGIQIAQYAPCSANGHKVHWVVLTGKDKVDRLCQMIRSHYRRTGSHPEIEEIFARGKNFLTLDAPNMVLTYHDAGAFCPEADCIIAMTTADLYWNKKGIGTCWAGFVMESANENPEIRAFLKIPDDKHIYGAIALGNPDEPPYPYIPERPKAVIDWLKPESLI